MSDLKPCPFCGGEAETLTAESMQGGYLFGIMCNECRSRGDVYDNEAEAIAAWNTRAERTCRIVNHGGLAGSVPLFTCEECEALFYGNAYGEAPNYCPECGRKVIDECSTC